MKEARYFYVPLAAELTELPVDEAAHALRVLRLSSGDEMFLMDGAGTFYRAIVTMTSSKHCLYEITERMPQQKGWNGHIHLAIAPTKMMERMEWMAEKATEVGFDEISFLKCKFSERKTLREDRIEKIVVSAVKQSRKAWMPLVHPLTDFRLFVETPRKGHKYIAHCYDEITKKDLFEDLKTLPVDEEITVMVGPEGDFSIDEVRLAMEHGYESVSLGSARLRTETAGLSAVMMAQLVKR
ncbi:MAG: 16S rRNA (uracil(1498)-N(3))-methyltransferase [Prevotella sp.]|nr:16S rRNA (uracil(1498)-N(3))-methyltransferase [Prevotella sp.]